MSVVVVSQWTDFGGFLSLSVFLILRTFNEDLFDSCYPNKWKEKAHWWRSAQTSPKERFFSRAGACERLATQLEAAHIFCQICSDCGQNLIGSFGHFGHFPPVECQRSPSANTEKTCISFFLFFSKNGQTGHARNQVFEEEEAAPFQCALNAGLMGADAAVPCFAGDCGLAALCPSFAQIVGIFCTHFFFQKQFVSFFEDHSTPYRILETQIAWSGWRFSLFPVFKRSQSNLGWLKVWPPYFFNWLKTTETDAEFFICRQLSCASVRCVRCMTGMSDKKHDHKCTKNYKPT